MNTSETSYEGNGSLSFHIHRVNISDDIYTYHKTFYNAKDFHDSRYDPAFSPILYAGETISCYGLISPNEKLSMFRIFPIL